MFYPILLSMIAAAAGVPARDPEPTIRVTLTNDGQYLPGDRAKVQVITRDDGYLLVFQVSPEGRLRVLFPLDPTDDNYVKGGKRYLLLGRGGREGFSVEAAGTGVVFAAVSSDPWRSEGYVVFGHWDYGVFNAINYDDTEPQLVSLAQGMAGGRFDYDIVGYTVASQVAAVAEEPAYVSGSVGVVDSCYNCAAPVEGVIYGTGYYNTSGLFDPYYYSPYYNYGPYYPAWSYGMYSPVYGAYYGYPTWNWGWGGCYGYCNGNPFNPFNPYYYPYQPYYPGYPYYGYHSAVPYGGASPYQMKSGDRTWSGSPAPYRPRFDNGYTATNSVSGALPGIGVQQHASFRNRSFSGGTAFAGGSAVNTGAVPVSKGNSGVNTTGRRRDAAPAATPSRPAGGSALGTTPPKAVPSRPRGQSPSSSQRSATSSMTPSTEKQFRPEARASRPTGGAPRAVAAPMPSTSTSPFERRMPMPGERSGQPATVPPVLRAAPAAVPAPAATKAAVEGRTSEPVLRRREPNKPAASEAPAPAPRPESQRDPSLGRSYGNEPSQPSGGAVSAPTGGWSGGGNAGGGGGRATSTPPSGNAGGGGGRASSPPPSSAPSGAVAGGGRRH